MKHLTESQSAMSNFPYFRYTLDWTLDSLARLGAGPIELYLNDPHFHVEDSGTAQCRALKRKLAERGMRVINLCPEQVKYPINIASANPYARQRSVEYYVKCLTFANELESPTVQFFAGWPCLDEPFEDVWKRSAESLAYLADIARGYGVNLTIEAADPLVTVLRDTSYIVRMLREVNHPNLHGMLDLYCLGMCNETIEQALENLKGEIYHIHFSDAQYEGLSAHVIPGTGVLDMDHILTLLDEAVYPYYMSLELMTPYERMPEEAMRQSVEWMRERMGSPAKKV